MSILDTFLILFDADASKLDKGLEHSEKGADGLLQKLKLTDTQSAAVGGKFLDLAKQGAALLGVGAGFAAFLAGLKNTAAEYTELGKLAEQFRSTTDEVDNFLDSSELLGISKEQAVGSLKSLDGAIQDTALGLGRAKKVFEELGVSVVDAAGKTRPTAEVMGDLAAKFKEFDRGKQLRIMERLGLDPALLKVFNADVGDLQRRMTMIDQSTGFDLDQAVKRSQAYTKAQKALGVELATVRMYLGKLGESFQLAALPWFTAAIETATKYIRIFSEYFITHGKFVEGVIVAIGGAITAFLLPALVRSAIASALFLAPYLLIGAVIAGLVTVFALLYDDISNFMAGNDSLIGQMLERWPVIGETIKSVMEVLKAGWDVAKEAGRLAFEDILAVVNLVVEAIKTVVEWAGKIGGAIGSGIGWVAGKIAGAKVDATTPGQDAASTQDGLTAGKALLGQASASPFAAQTSGSITNSTASKNTRVEVGGITVNTQSTDPAGIAREVGSHMGQQMRQAAANFDDGVSH